MESKTASVGQAATGGASVSQLSLYTQLPLPFPLPQKQQTQRVREETKSEGSHHMPLLMWIEKITYEIQVILFYYYFFIRVQFANIEHNTQFSSRQV